MAPTNKQEGIEYGILCPSPAATDLLLTADCSKVRHFDRLPPGYLGNLAAPMEKIQKGFLKLVCLEEMNGAILYTSDTEMTFQRVDRVSLGESSPVIEEKKAQ
ncbi:hypothetical protein PoB_000910100 [Plakobranchus ocellatus]|uniref:Uncharacterized protein n=1 Tax=Plakobranchus ocellatus TaxID=259542 RepID=A0AAV3Y5R9_9GAST|nr:hypothetical protein PoB_000910100 [Plakobranchus ocellatus]